jgi:hypothetical protein
MAQRLANGFPFPVYINETLAQQSLAAGEFIDQTSAAAVIPPGNGRGQGGPKKGPHKSPGSGNSYAYRKRNRIDFAYLEGYAEKRRKAAFVPAVAGGGGGFLTMGVGT